MGRPSSNWDEIKLLFDYLYGICGSEPEQGRIMTKRTRVFFLGNAFPKREIWDPNPSRREEQIEEDCEIAQKIDSCLDGLAVSLNLVTQLISNIYFIIG